MKAYLAKTIFFISLLPILILCGCKKDSPSPEQKRINELTASWIVSSVENDGTDVTSEFAGFTLTVTGEKTYSTVNGGNPWPASGTFDFVEGNLDLIIRDDDVEVTIDAVSETTLSLSFRKTNIGNQAAGIQGVTGQFTFNLTRKTN